MAIATTNPATGEVIKAFDPMTHDEIEVRLERAHRGYEVLRRTSFAQRAAWMRAAADILDAEVDDVARTMTIEMGKTFASAKGEVAKCAKGCRFYADHAEGISRRRAGRSRIGWRHGRAGALPADRPSARGHAVEFPVVAGDAVRCAGVDGGQCRAAQAREQRAAVRAVPRRPVPARRIPRRLVPDLAHRRS